MLTLHQPPAVWGIPNLSPFCVKLESYLRLAGIPYQAKAGSPAKAPRGKVPYILDEGTMVGDSELIIEYLKKKHGDPLDGSLTPEQKALGHVVRRTLEEGTYWNLVWLRWIEPAGWEVLRPVFRRMIPPGIRMVVLPMIRSNLRKTLHGQGTGRHAPEVICRQAEADLTAVSLLLGDKPYLLGDQPTTVDCTVYAFVTGITAFPADSSVRRHAMGLKNLMDYTERFRQRVYADWTPAYSLT